MRLNIANNIKTCYYNYLVTFYICLNSIIPLYDDVILSLQRHSMKLLIGDNDPHIRMKDIKRKRMIEFIYSLSDGDKLFFEKEKNLLIIEYLYDVCDSSDSQNVSTYQEAFISPVSRKRHREEDVYDNVDKSINDEINKTFDITRLNTILNTNSKNKDD